MAMTKAEHEKNKAELIKRFENQKDCVLEIMEILYFVMNGEKTEDEVIERLEQLQDLSATEYVKTDELLRKYDGLVVLE